VILPWFSSFLQNPAVILPIFYRDFNTSLLMTIGMASEGFPIRWPLLDCSRGLSTADCGAALRWSEFCVIPFAVLTVKSRAELVLASNRFLIWWYILDCGSCLLRHVASAPCLRVFCWQTPRFSFFLFAKRRDFCHYQTAVSSFLYLTCLFIIKTRSQLHCDGFLIFWYIGFSLCLCIVNNSNGAEWLCDEWVNGF